MGRYLGEGRYVEAAVRAVTAWQPQVMSLATFAGELGRAALELGPATEVRVGQAGAGGAGAAPEAFLASALRSGLPAVDVRLVGATGTAGRARAYPCRGDRCLAPVEEPSLLAEALRAWALEGPEGS